MSFAAHHLRVLSMQSLRGGARWVSYETQASEDVHLGKNMEKQWAHSPPCLKSEPSSISPVPPQGA